MIMRSSFILLCFLVAAKAVLASDILVIEVGGQVSGKVEIELLEDIAPKHVERVKYLAETGAYNNVVFHRVIDGFMAQTGDVQFGLKDSVDLAFAGRGGSQLPNLPAEFSLLSYEKGTVGMARSQHPDSANSQFFIMFSKAPFLDGKYTVFGRVISGQDTVDLIKKGQGSNGEVTEPDYMSKVYIKN